MKTEVDYCHQWHRLCEMAYREYRATNPPIHPWQDFVRKNPGLQLPEKSRGPGDLQPYQLAKMIDQIVQAAVGLRVMFVDLGLLDLVNPSIVHRLPASIYGAESDPFDVNGFSDNPPDKP